MRILKVSFENINSLRGQHTIDFQNEAAFRNSNLFAITGPTGAGKTTILDVITLALYHRTPRLGEVNSNLLEKLGGILTRDTNQAYAEVSFTTPRGSYRAKWSLQREIISRGANKGQARLDEYAEIADLESNTILASKKKKEVQEEIRKRVGLDYEQFVKAILLSQGDFAAFLKARREERAELLERITGTEIYRKLGMEAFSRWHDHHKKEIESKQQSLDLQKILTEEELKVLLEEIEKHEELYRVSETKRKSLEVQVQRKKRIREIQTALDVLHQREYPRWNVDKQTFDTQDALVLERHERVQQFSEPLTNYQLQEQSLKSTKLQWERITKEQALAQQNQKQLLSDIAGLVTELVTAQSAQRSIEVFREKVSQSYTDQQMASQNWGTAKNQAFELLTKTQSPEIQSFWSRGAYADCLSISREAWQEINQRKTELQQLYQLDKNTDVQTLRQESMQRREAYQQLEIQVRHYENLRKRLTDYDRQVEEQRKLIHEQLPLIHKSTQEVTEARNLLQIAQEEQLNFIRETSIPRLRTELSTEQPCPVCGSTHHPVLLKTDEEDHFSVDTYLRELENLKARFEARERNLATLETRLRQLENDKKGIEVKIQTLEAEKANAQTEEKPIIQVISKWKADLKIEKIGKSEEVRDWLQKETERFQHLEELLKIQEKSESLAQFGRHLKEGLSYFQKHQELTDALKKLYVKDIKFLAGDCDGLLQKLVHKSYSPEQYTQELEECQQSYTQAEIAFKSLKDKLLTELSTFGFSSVEEAKAALLSPDNHRKLTQQKEQLVQRKTQLDTQLDTLTQEITLLQEQDEAAIEISTLLTEIETHSMVEREYLQKIGGWKQSLKDNEVSRTEHAKRLEEIAELEQRYKKWRLLAEGLGDREGKKFNQFAQKLTLANLARSANSRLKDLSDRYLLLPPEGDEENLWVLDRNFDERRAVSTLSGGETFLVSLALALGLSDMVSKNVRIESLFIDEGFGTLDPDTLEIALGTLEKLQAESNRMIGIISHVEALKERITTQIQLRKQASGFSEMEIVG
ncbi:AAA family ATPase [Siphonobacter sp. SORGH_AS_1065]|uniref:AAA family ATPase n=1 Tax=Siphonobacter sp. SORGH_AS_1065 TaxID=3041795 RepID=UPI002789C7D3|nr:AAA family ATPase [Siphonobacter sp. SORGH_AS_1065]MDQ1087038.1 exonuclease SbcC [Siphonobacter sp. SORGH_AS_1065]